MEPKCKIAMSACFAAALSAASCTPSAGPSEAIATPIDEPVEEIRTFAPAGLPDSTQFGYSQVASVSTDARTVYVAGQVGIVPDRDTPFGQQVDVAFNNLSLALQAAGATKSDVIKITLLIVDHDPDKLAKLVEKRRAYFGDNPPASLLVPVPQLYADGVLFEVDAVAVIAKSPAQEPRQ